MAPLLHLSEAELATHTSCLFADHWEGAAAVSYWKQKGDGEGELSEVQFGLFWQETKLFG